MGALAVLVTACAHHQPRLAPGPLPFGTVAFVTHGHPYKTGYSIIRHPDQLETFHQLHGSAGTREALRHFDFRQSMLLAFVIQFSVACGPVTLVESARFENDSIKVHLAEPNTGPCQMVMAWTEFVRLPQNDETIVVEGLSPKEIRFLGLNPLEPYIKVAD